MILISRLRSDRRVKPKEIVNRLTGMTQDHIERLKPVFIEIAVPRQGINSEDLIRIVVKQHMLRGIKNPRPASRLKIPVDLPLRSGFPRILRLTDGK